MLIHENKEHPFKGTVRPDWILWFFNFTLEYLKRLQSSEPLHAKMNPTSCLFRSRFAKNPVFLLADALLCDKKICQSAALFWFGWQDAGILYSPTVFQRTIDYLPHFWSTVQRKRSQLEHMQTVIQTSRRLDSFLHEAAQNLNSYQIFKIKNKKPTAVDVLLKAYLMILLSCRSNLARR